MITRRDFGKLSLAASALITSSRLMSETNKVTPAESVNPRRVGRRPHGTYWGAGSEKIDLLSGNLSFCMRLLHLQSRQLSATLSLSYNSQLSTSSADGVILPHGDGGFGFGWRFQLASIVPQLLDGQVSGYTYVDQYGSERPLTRFGNVYLSLDGSYMTWDPAAATLKTASGKAIRFDCISGPHEHDAGALYPTLITCSNGNQISIEYAPGRHSAQADTSGRVTRVSDARSVFAPAGADIFVFTYSVEAQPHLLSITSNLQTPETYTLGYTEQTFTSPFAGAASEPSRIQALTSITDAAGRVSKLNYNSFGELTSVTTGHGGTLGWQYSTVTFANGISVREVSARTAQESESASIQTHTFTRDASDGQGDVHSTAILTEHNQTSSRVWTFNCDKQSPDCGLVSSITSYSGSKPLRRSVLSWGRTLVGAPYLSLHTTVLDPGTSSEQTKRTSSTRDQYGNLLSHSLYSFDDPSTPSKTITHTYLTDPAYLSKHILNRALTKKITSRQDNEVTVEAKYDTTPLIACNGLTHHDSVAYSSASTVRGNVTERIAGGVRHTMHFDQSGLTRSVEDDTGSKVEFIPADGTNNTRIGTAIPNGNLELAHTVSFTTSGLPQTMTGPNGAQSLLEHDALGRTVSVTSVSGAVTKIAFGVSPTTVTRSINGRWSKHTADGFGRSVKTEHGDESGTTKVSLVEYAPTPHTTLGKVARRTLSHAPGETPTWVHKTYDDMGRLTTHDSASAIGLKTIEHTGNTTSVSDAAGRWKKLVHDAQGKLVKVVLPSPNGDADQETRYLYDTLGRMTGVVMPRNEGTQQRRFQYDSGGRPIFRKHAESGAVKMTYNSDGTLSTKVDAKGQKEVYTRDAFKRVVLIRRYDGKGVLQPNETVSFFYDNNPFDSSFSENVAGRLGAVQWGSTATMPGLMTKMFSYTVSGRIAAQRLRINRGQNDLDLDMSCTYDDEGRLETLKYPVGGPSLLQTYDSLGHLVRVDSSSNAVVKDVTYNAAGHMTGLKLLASASGHYMEETRQYDERHRLTQIATGPAAGAEDNPRIPKVDLQYTYRDSDGMLHAETDAIQGASTTYDYDIQRRLASAHSSDGDWSLAFEYDGFGNRVSQKVTQGSAYEHEVHHDPATNWMLSDDTAYDANGNITSLPYLRLSYDTMNRLKHITLPAGEEYYAYDPHNKRVWTKTTQVGEQVFFWSGNKVLACYGLTTDATGNLSAKLKAANIHFGKRIVTTRGEVLVIDRLGATRAWSTQDGAQVTKYLPFGEELKKTSNDVAKFGGYDRNASSSLDYAQNRYYSSALGRFVTPDPYEKSAKAKQPGTWNRYAFVSNDPVNHVDPLGLNDSSIFQVGHTYALPNADGSLSGASVTITGVGVGVETLPDGTQVDVSINDWGTATSATELVAVPGANGDTGTVTLTNNGPGLNDSLADLGAAAGGVGTVLAGLVGAATIGEDASLTIGSFELEGAALAFLGGPVTIAIGIALIILAVSAYEIQSSGGK